MKSLNGKRESHIRRLMPVVTIGIGMCLNCGCSTVRRERDIVPEHLVEEAHIPAIPKARSWADVHPEGLEKWFQLSSEEIKQDFSGVIGRKHVFLAISGGGANGAFGAGVLAGWSKTGNRPDFTIITGVSTGAIIAPFAFLGAEYDDELHDLYTRRSTKEVLVKYNFLKGYRSDAFTDSAPLRALLANALGEAEIRKIAFEHRKGRRLYVGTVNMDCLRPVLWNIGAIADSGSPGARDLILDVIIASTSVPVVSPPTFIDVNVGGRIYQEMHVDGGLSAQVFLYPSSIKWSEVEERLMPQGQTQVYVIRNAKLKAEWAPVDARIRPLGSRAISSLISSQGRRDLEVIYHTCARDGLKFHYTYIPDDFNEEKNEQFDVEYMEKLYNRAAQLVLEGKVWKEDRY